MGERLPAGCTKPTGRRILVEGTIILLIFSLFLEITNIINYLIFVAIWYTILFFLVLWFKSYTYCVIKNEIIINSLFSKKRIELHNLKDAFISQGPIAKRLKCGSIYIIPENGKIAVLVDIENPQIFLEKIQNSRP
ncbi:MAG: PH domain-containing protein [Saccharolobus sp.]